MLFNTFSFFVFFIILTGLYFVSPYKYRWLLLLAGSCYFYMAFIPVYIVVLAYTIIVDYVAGLYIEKAQGHRRKIYLLFSLIANIGALSIFKYYNFVNDNLSFLLNTIGFKDPLPYLKIILPIGLSFHTFQAMSYTIEVYRGNQKAERHFGIYALYVMFYPQLVAGPIERPQNLLYQFRKKFDFDYERVTDGLKLMGWGLFKKAVIADRLAIFVDSVYKSPQSQNSLILIIATFFFSFQIFCDFSGYSDMAIGAAKVMGFDLMKNFDKPYHSKSISEFWKRWHISLSSWFRDYLYISLGGNKVSIPLWYLNIFIVFLISGLWHGANWTFIVWGALNGLYLIFGIVTKDTRVKIASRLKLDKVPFVEILVTFFLISFAWIFFRADNIKLALLIIERIFSGFPEIISNLVNHKSVFINSSISKEDMILSFSLILFLELVHYLQTRIDINEYIKNKPITLRWLFYYLSITIIFYLGVFESRHFIYFQF